MGVSAVEYVMVPVPEELAAEVLTYISWKGHPVLTTAVDAAINTPQSRVEASDPGEDEPMPRAFARLDDAGRSLVKVVVDAALDHEELTIPEAARRAHLSIRELVGAAVELNNLVESEGGPPMVVWIKAADGATADEFTWDDRVIMMPEPVARPLADLVRDHTAS